MSERSADIVFPGELREQLTATATMLRAVGHNIIANILKKKSDQVFPSAGDEKFNKLELLQHELRKNDISSPMSCTSDIENLPHLLKAINAINAIHHYIDLGAGSKDFPILSDSMLTLLELNSNPLSKNACTYGNHEVLDDPFFGKTATDNSIQELLRKHENDLLKITHQMLARMEKKGMPQHAPLAKRLEHYQRAQVPAPADGEKTSRISPIHFSNGSPPLIR